MYLERDVLAEGDIARDREVVQLQKVWDVVKPAQKLTHLPTVINKIK